MRSILRVLTGLARPRTSGGTLPEGEGGLAFLERELLEAIHQGDFKRALALLTTLEEIECALLGRVGVSTASHRGHGD